MDEKRVFDRAEARKKRVYELWEQWKLKLWQRAMEQTQTRCRALNLPPVNWTEQRADECEDDASERFKESLTTLFSDPSSRQWIENLYAFTKRVEENEEENFENLCARIMHAAESHAEFITDIRSDEANSADDDTSESEGEDYVYKEASSDTADGDTSGEEEKEDSDEIMYE